MSRRGGLLRTIAYREMPVAQIFEADFTIRSANEYGDDIAFINFDKLKGEVSTLSWDPVSKEIETKQVQRLDVTGLIISLATGYKVVIRVETRDGDMAAYQLLGVKEKENGKVKVAVKAIGEGYVILKKKVLRNAKMEISLAGIAPIESFTALADMPRFWSWSSDAIQARYDSIKERLIIANDLPTVQEIFYSAEARVPLLMEFKSSSSSGEGEVIKAVAKVRWMKVDGDGCHVKLSNKGCKGVGKTAKEAIAALDKWKSGSCSMRIVPLADASYMAAGAGTVAFDAGADCLGQVGHVLASDRRRARKYVADLIPIDVEGMLKKTKKVGVFELQFRNKEGDSILYKDDKNTIRSKPVTSYLKVLAEKYDEPAPLSNDPDVAWWKSEQLPIMIQINTASGKSLLGVVAGLTWNAKKGMKGMWVAKVGLGVLEAKRLQKNSKILEVGKLLLWSIK
jgi:hypothetical protein